MINFYTLSIFTNIVEFLNKIKDFLLMPSYSPSFSAAMGFINFAAYFLPIGTIKAVFLVWLSINIISFIIRIVKTVWDLIPVL